MLRLMHGHYVDFYLFRISLFSPFNASVCDGERMRDSQIYTNLFYLQIQYQFSYKSVLPYPKQKKLFIWLYMIASHPNFGIESFRNWDC